VTENSGWCTEHTNKLKSWLYSIYLIIVYKDHGLSTCCLGSWKETSLLHFKPAALVLDLQVSRLHVIITRWMPCEDQVNFLRSHNLIWHFYSAYLTFYKIFIILSYCVLLSPCFWLQIFCTDVFIYQGFFVTHTVSK
jgi:hypothetical protein